MRRHAADCEFSQLRGVSQRKYCRAHPIDFAYGVLEAPALFVSEVEFSPETVDRARARHTDHGEIQWRPPHRAASTPASFVTLTSTAHSSSGITPFQGWTRTITVRTFLPTSC